MKWLFALIACAFLIGCGEPPSGLVTDKDTYVTIVYVGKVPVIQTHYRLHIGNRSTTVSHDQYARCSVGENYPECKD